MNVILKTKKTRLTGASGMILAIIAEMDSSVKIETYVRVVMAKGLLSVVARVTGVLLGRVIDFSRDLTCSSYSR